MSPQIPSAKFSQISQLRQVEQGRLAHLLWDGTVHLYGKEHGLWFLNVSTSYLIIWHYLKKWDLFPLLWMSECGLDLVTHS